MVLERCSLPLETGRMLPLSTSETKPDDRVRFSRVAGREPSESTRTARSRYSVGMYLNLQLPQVLKNIQSHMVASHPEVGTETRRADTQPLAG
jgi:hypothetical protein